MPMQIDAVYEDGVLKPLQPLALSEHQRVTVIISEPGPKPDSAYVERLRRELETAEPAPGLEEVRRRLAKIPGTMTDDFIAERGER